LFGNGEGWGEEGFVRVFKYSKREGAEESVGCEEALGGLDTNLGFWIVERRREKDTAPR